MWKQIAAEIARITVQHVPMIQTIVRFATRGSIWKIVNVCHVLKNANLAQEVQIPIVYCVVMAITFIHLVAHVQAIVQLD